MLCTGNSDLVLRCDVRSLQYSTLNDLPVAVTGILLTLEWHSSGEPSLAFRYHQTSTLDLHNTRVLVALERAVHRTLGPAYPQISLQPRLASLPIRDASDALLGHRHRHHLAL